MSLNENTNKNIINRLSSQSGDRTERSNIEVAIECLSDMDCLNEIAGALGSKDSKLVGDCAEVLTKVAEEKPGMVVPYISELIPLLKHKYNKARWEAVHALSLVIEFSIGESFELVETLYELVKKDKSVIVRDYAVVALGKYAKKGEQEAILVFPFLKEALELWEGKHAGHALDGLINVAEVCKSIKDELHSIALEYSNHTRLVIKKSAKSLLRTIEKKG